MKKLADGGDICTLGFHSGTVLRGNQIHDVHRSRYTHGGAPNNGFFIDEDNQFDKAVTPQMVEEISKKAGLQQMPECSFGTSKAKRSRNRDSRKGRSSMNLFISRSIGVIALLFPTAAMLGDVRVPALFSDHMVLQRDVAAPVWGWADPGEDVTVSLAGQTRSAKADGQGKWMVKLESLKAGGPHVMTIKGKTTATINDVLVGEVWLGSGQSNMAMTVVRAKNFEQEKAAADLPQVRMFTVASGASETAQTDCKGTWVVCSPQAAGSFSATLFFFGREIHKTLGTPVGLINSSVGGTPIESWISPEAQRASAELKGFFEQVQKDQADFDPQAAKAKYEKDLARWKEQAQKAKAEGKPAPRQPRDPVQLRQSKGNIGGLFNGKIAPLIPFAIRGVVWYQGEANSTEAKAPFYQHQLPLLVTDWRTRWRSELPFAWVQLPNFTRGEGWCLVREAMLKSLKLPKTGMAIAIDIGDPKDIHPVNKQDVGKRLAMWVLGTVYGQKTATSGPLPMKHEIRGGEVVVTFAHADGGLVSRDGELKGFALAGPDKQWKPARARIDGDKVIVSCPEVTAPAAVRYAWSDNPQCNLYNGAGLPASPFRTDDW